MLQILLQIIINIIFIDKVSNICYYLFTEYPKVFKGGTTMDALQKVFDTIKEVLAIIKKFFDEIFPKKEEETEPEA